MAVLMASHTRSVFSASRMVLPTRISEAMAAEWVMPEQPMVSTSASSITPFLTFRVSLHAPCWGAHQPTPWVRPEISVICFAFTHLPASGIGAGSCFAPLQTHTISSTSREYCTLQLLLVYCKTWFLHSINLVYHP